MKYGNTFPLILCLRLFTLTPIDNNIGLVQKTIDEYGEMEDISTDRILVS